MKNLLLLLFQLLRILGTLVQAGGVKALVAENLLLKFYHETARRTHPAHPTRVLAAEGVAHG